MLPKIVSQKHKALRGLEGSKKSKSRSKRGPKYKIAYHKAKRDIKAPKIHSQVVKLVCYLKVSVRSIFSITPGAYKGKKTAKIGPKEGLRDNITYHEANLEIDQIL